MTDVGCKHSPAGSFQTTCTRHRTLRFPMTDETDGIGDIKNLAERRCQLDILGVVCSCLSLLWPAFYASDDGRASAAGCWDDSADKAGRIVMAITFHWGFYCDRSSRRRRTAVTRLGYVSAEEKNQFPKTLKRPESVGISPVYIQEMSTVNLRPKIILFFCVQCGSNNGLCTILYFANTKSLNKWIATLHKRRSFTAYNVVLASDVKEKFARDANEFLSCFHSRVSNSTVDAVET